MDAKEQTAMEDYDFSTFPNVELTGMNLDDFSLDELSVLYQQARYCQAMTDADIDTMTEIVSEDTTFTHMSGKTQSREEYFEDVRNGSLRYYSIGIDHPVVKLDGTTASVTFTAILNANAYGARGSFHMSGTYWYEKRGNIWIVVNEKK